jgi:hypothetical protein
MPGIGAQRASGVGPGIAAASTIGLVDAVRPVTEPYPPGDDPCDSA